MPCSPPGAGGGPRALTKCHYLTAVSEGLLFPGSARAEMGGHLARRPLRGLRGNRASRDHHLTPCQAGPAGIGSQGTEVWVGVSGTGASPQPHVRARAQPGSARPRPSAAWSGPCPGLSAARRAPSPEPRARSAEPTRCRVLLPRPQGALSVPRGLRALRRERSAVGTGRLNWAYTGGGLRSLRSLRRCAPQWRRRRSRPRPQCENTCAGPRGCPRHMTQPPRDRPSVSRDAAAGGCHGGGGALGLGGRCGGGIGCGVG